MLERQMKPVEVLALVGMLLALVGMTLMLLEAFNESVLWGLFSFLIPPVLIVFAIDNWDRCQKGFILWLIGIILGAFFGFFWDADSMS